MTARAKLIGTIIVPLLFFISCNERIEDPGYVSSKIKETIYEGMQEWYFWNKELPVTIHVDDYQSNEELLEYLKYKTFDKWSYLTSIEAFKKSFTGQNAGHGVGYSLDGDDRVLISFVYKNSPAGQAGLERGWEIIEVNSKPISAYRTGTGYNLQLGPNQVGVTNSFKFRLPDGTLVDKTISKSEYQSNSVLYQDVLEINGKKTGYWVYNSFKATPQTEPVKSVEVDESMAYFEEHQIRELIIDLRYNGGGSVAVAEQLMNYLIPAGSSGKLMYTNAFNGNKSGLNEEHHFKKLGQLELNRLIFITSRGTASSSELIINCLEPYLDVVLIGDDTYGKPVGAFPLSSFYERLEENDVELVPITFAIANAEGKAGYYDGLQVAFQIADDPSHNWGDPEDGRLKAAIELLQTGQVGTSDRVSYRPPAWAMIDNFDGLEKEFPVY